jgi:hypothetical protein
MRAGNANLRGNEMKCTGIPAAIAALMLWSGIATAVPSGKTVEFASPRGKVTFDGKVHANKGLQMRGLP